MKITAPLVAAIFVSLSMLSVTVTAVVLLPTSNVTGRWPQIVHIAWMDPTSGFANFRQYTECDPVGIHFSYFERSSIRVIVA